MTEQILSLLVAFQFKHWLCDYPLQTPFMLKKFQKEGWVYPLFCHARVHAVTTLLISVVFLSLYSDMTVNEYARIAVWMMFLDGVVHFIVDRIKAHPSIGGRWKTDNPKFWWALGADQSLHHLTHYGIIYVLVSSL